MVTHPSSAPPFSDPSWLDIFRIGSFLPVAEKNLYKQRSPPNTKHIKHQQISIKLEPKKTYLCDLHYVHKYDCDYFLSVSHAHLTSVILKSSVKCMEI